MPKGNPPLLVYTQTLLERLFSAFLFIFLNGARAGVGFSFNPGGGTSTSTLVLSRCGVSYSLLEQTIDPGKKEK